MTAARFRRVHAPTVLSLADMIRRLGLASLLLGAATILAALLWPAPEPVAPAGVMAEAPAVASVIESRIVPLALGLALVACGIVMLAWGRRERARDPE